MSWRFVTSTFRRHNVAVFGLAAPLSSYVITAPPRDRRSLFGQPALGEHTNSPYTPNNTRSLIYIIRTICWLLPSPQSSTGVSIPRLPIYTEPKPNTTQSNRTSAKRHSRLPLLLHLQSTMYILQRNAPELGQRQSLCKLTLPNSDISLELTSLQGQARRQRQQRRRQLCLEMQKL